MKMHGLKRIGGPQLAMIAFVGIITGSALWALTRATGRHIVTCAEATAPIAVTSSSNPTSDARRNYLGDGIAQEVINKLKKIPGLNRPTRTSTSVQKGRNAGHRARITTQRAPAQQGFQVWSRSDIRRPIKLLHITLAGDPQYAEAWLSEAVMSGSLAIRVSDPLAEGAAAERLPQQAGSTAFAVNKPKPVSDWGAGDGKSHWVPAYESVGFEFLLNQYDRHFLDASVYGTNFSSFRHNLGSGWVIDTDPFETNQFLHPYQGSIFHGFARSAGLSFWQSMAYAFGGSLIWKEAGETIKSRPRSLGQSWASRCSAWRACC